MWSVRVIILIQTPTIWKVRSIVNTVQQILLRAIIIAAKESNYLIYTKPYKNILEFINCLIDMKMRLIKKTTSHLLSIFKKINPTLILLYSISSSRRCCFYYRWPMHTINTCLILVLFFFKYKQLLSLSTFIFKLVTLFNFHIFVSITLHEVVLNLSDVIIIDIIIIVVLNEIFGN